ncbi:MAG TPA: RNA 2',3'-cyclic phosphodiesterase [Actinomycetota bacterium]|nr:RNA 2',3'-cyclic phosphodiesterase [Actinomycetota bacterium]
MTGRLRLFVAAEVPREQRDHVARVLEPWRERLSGARWTDPAAQHVTLKFLGSSAADDLERVTRATASAAEACRPGPVRLGGLGAFPRSDRMRVLWIGLDEPTGVLSTLAAALQTAFVPLGFEPEARAYRPHLTLARFRVPARLPHGLVDLPAVDLPAFEVREIVLFRSHLSPTGARYEPLVSLPVGATGVNSG